MFAKRKYSSLFADFGYEQQENAAAGAGTSAQQQCQPKSPLVESSQRQNISSMFVNSRQKLNSSVAIGSSPRPSHWNTMQSTCLELLNISCPTNPCRAKALPICWSNNSTRPASIQRESRASPRKISELWSELNEQLDGSTHADASDDSYIDSPPATQLAPEQTQVEYLPAGSCKKAADPRRMPRCVKGGYVAEFRATMKRVRMNQRHPKTTDTSHTVRVLDISTECGVHMARMQYVSAPG
ncbi:uncharacterized protein LOC111064681 [Drosophila obscura]|uniref:uncharacterized protein LOC111064681 n=1 Tax=Drosophila obscura TaxID=7282 RepID=UPI001BB18124|nr:uncharacterized protein LOC111064681 [Drosophila obscura]